MVARKGDIPEGISEEQAAEVAHLAAQMVMAALKLLRRYLEPVGLDPAQAISLIHSYVMHWGTTALLDMLQYIEDMEGDEERYCEHKVQFDVLHDLSCEVGELATPRTKGWIKRTRGE